jgi:hypothetical protein
MGGEFRHNITKISRPRVIERGTVIKQNDPVIQYGNVIKLAVPSNNKLGAIDDGGDQTRDAE